MIAKQYVVAALTAGLTASFALAQTPDDYEDVGIKVENGRVVTKAMSEPFPGGVDFSDSRVFSGEFIVQGGLTFTDEPGLFAQDNTFAPGSIFSFNVLKALRVWNGTNFDTISSERLRLELGLASVFTPTTDSLTTGLSFNVPFSGGFDQHFDVFLVDSALGNSTTTGIFLLEVEYSNSLLTAGPSLSNFILFNNNASAPDFDAAADYVTNTLVPSPASVALMAIGSLVAARRRRG